MDILLAGFDDPFDFMLKANNGIWDLIGVCSASPAFCHFEQAVQAGRTCAHLRIDDPTQANMNTRNIRAMCRIPTLSKEITADFVLFLDPAEFIANPYVEICRIIEEAYPFPSWSEATWFRINAVVLPDRRIQVAENRGGGQYLDVPLNPTAFHTSQITLPLSQWFTLSVSCRRDLVDGLFELRVNGSLAIGFNGRTQGMSDDTIEQAAQSYLDGGLHTGVTCTTPQRTDPTPISLYADSVHIYESIPPNGGVNGHKPCMIAAAFLGTPLAAAFPLLRQWRDQHFPIKLTRNYYQLSKVAAPKIAALRQVF